MDVIYIHLNKTPDITLHRLSLTLKRETLIANRASAVAQKPNWSTNQPSAEITRTFIGSIYHISNF